MIKDAMGTPNESESPASEKVDVAVRNYLDGVIDADEMVRERPVILGSIALRLAGCYEEGLGCEQSFERALEWYDKAVSGLEFAVEAGETWYEKALSGARAGAKRCQQEILP